ncbi:serine/threonine-protein kinase ZRK3-like isoform X5 [Quercus robur]|uniref:serine/threonine-protein kinase ZRK3-like isoform X5 n=1 Tax=Quercus robur TaxID=38942 RepID=UPI0021636E3B|nr:serine/threonine-protein kinase ZRK3-like isoform X5 [Quercus robur]XP_050246479.1 serine/threonine-protein kinase ZRK3-like isoform X5 [Quercus robur]
MRWSWFTDHFFNKRKQREERAFYENGSLLLEKLIASCNAKPIPIRTFSAQQLRQATNNFSSEQLVTGFSIRYKVSLEGRTVLIKGSFVRNAKPIPIRTFSAQQLRQATNNFSSEQLVTGFSIRYKVSLEGRIVLIKSSFVRNAKPIPIRTFSPQQLRQATDNYPPQHLGIYWYKGSLEGRIVFIKHLDGWADLGINDLVISAQMSGHSNVLKPVGCCLHTPYPFLVFEFAANGFLSNRIYVSRVTELQHQPMVWERRLKIARQIAHALSYLHTAFPRPVIHMAISMRCILLDENDVPKLSGFYFSVSIPEGEADVEGFEGFRQFGLCAPEFKATGKVTEKADVYDFGRILLELLTGEDSLNTTRWTIDEDSSLVAYIHNRAQGSCINEIVDPAILAEGGASLQYQLQAVADLALTCTEEDPQRRPTMVDVTKQLRRIERFTQECEALLGSLQNLKLHERLEMLLWKIANDILPTEARMKPTCKMETTCCPLCETEEETCLHLFKNCSVAKAVWFSSSWGFFIESLNANNSFDLIKSIVSPPAHVLPEQVTKGQFVLMAAKIMDHIWSLRNQVVCENKKINFQAIPFQNFSEI